MAASQIKVMNQKLEKIDGAVKVCDSRRKQKWIRTPTPIPPTPPGSPSVLPEPLLDELLELWVGVGMDEPSYKQHDISLKSALDSLEFDDEDTFHIVGEYGGDSDTGNENEELLNRLLDRHHFDDSPPPTNPASPREFRDQEVEIQSEEETYTTVTAVETEYFNTVEEEELTETVETVVCSVIEDEGEEEAVEMDLEEFDAFPKTEPITSEFSSHFFDSYFESAFPDLEERTTGLMAEEVEEEVVTPMIEEETIPIDNSETISSIINYNFNDDVEVKHDCMWAGSCESDSHQKDFEELFGTSLAPRIDSSFYGDDDHYGDVIQTVTTSPQEEEQEMDEELEIDTNLEVLRSKILGDHSYAFSGYGPVHQNTQSSTSNITSAQSNSQSSVATINLSSTAQTTHSIPGIVMKQDESSPKKTKIIVPLKDLMETLKQKSFYVSPGGPGKSVIRLTGSGETVRGVFELAKCKQSNMSSAVGLALNGSATFTTANGGKASFSVKKSNPKLKKAIHKPKQELSSCQSSTNSSRTTTTSSLGFNLQQSNGSCNSNSSCNSHNSGCSLTSSSSSISSSSASSPHSSLSGNPSGKPRKTKTHNNMERMRRIDLRNSFDTLRKLVPVLTKANKCSKVEILKSATEYINGLKLIEKKISKEEQALRTRHETLRARLAALTSTST